MRERGAGGSLLPRGRAARGVGLKREGLGIGVRPLKPLNRFNLFLPAALPLVVAAGCLPGAHLEERAAPSAHRLLFFGGGLTTHFGRSRDSGEAYNSFNEGVGLRWECAPRVRPGRGGPVVGAAVLAFKNSNYDASRLAGFQAAYRFAPRANLDTSLGATVALVSGYEEFGGGEPFLYLAPMVTLSFRNVEEWWQRFGLFLNVVPDYGGATDPSVTLLVQFTFYDGRSRSE